MKKTLLVLISLTLMAGIAYANDFFNVHGKTDGHDILIAFDKSSPAVGDNNLTMEIKDPSGQKVKNAEVELYYFMSSMPAMNSTVKAVKAAGKYTAVIAPSMGGEWTVEVRFRKPGEHKRKIAFNINFK